MISDVRKVVIRKILIICQGNLCRSPIAEVECRKRLADRGLGEVIVDSAGLNTRDDLAAHPSAIDVAKEHNLNLDRHRSKMLTEDMVRWADIMFVMSPRQKQLLLNSFPYVRGKTFLLGREGQQIDDPLGLPRASFAAAHAEICDGIDDWLDRLFAMSRDSRPHVHDRS